jgi:two-component system, LytTR family, response regulator
MLKTILIDDEVRCTASLQIQLKDNCPEVAIAGVYNDALAAIKAIQTSPPDLVFLDIEMPRMNGFQLLDIVQNAHFSVIFTTAYDQFAVKAFKYSALDYLLKPIDDEELKEAVQKARYRHQTLPLRLNMLEKHLQNGDKMPEKIALPYQEGYLFVNPQEIIYCETDDNYTKFHLLNGQSMISSKPLREIEDILEGLDFFRIHKQYLVNTNQVKKYVKNGGPYVVMSNGVNLTIARNRKEDFQNLFLKL